MRNPFVDYLNTLHNAAGANTNALAESQAVEPFYKHLQVRRRVGKHLARMLQGEPRCIILTGHAGDGKTGLLHQILVDLGALDSSAAIPRASEATMPGRKMKLFFAKDMSELSAAEQENLLIQALQAPQDGSSSILVSNTGPLLHTFKRLQEKGKLPGSFQEFQSDLLTAMDASEPNSVQLDGYEFVLVNMARIDNVGMVGLLLQNLTAEAVWADCQACPARDKCPVLNNAITVRRNLERATSFIETYLLWLQEHDSRLTLRQILAQLAYAMTSNLSCENIHSFLDTKHYLFRFHFANALWGFRGVEDNPASSQLQAVSSLRRLQLDEKSVGADYNLFVRKDLSAFDDATRELIDEFLRGKIVDGMSPVADARGRKSVRRFYYLFASQEPEAEFEQLLGSLFSPVLPSYLRLRYGRALQADRRLVKRALLQGLYRSIVGVPRLDGKDGIHVTLRHDRSGITGVQLLLGEVRGDELELRSEPVEAFGDYPDNRPLHAIVLKLRNSAAVHEIRLPLLDYLYHLAEGVVSTRVNPYLSHGIDKIKASLMEYVGKSEDDVRLLVLTPDGPETLELFIDGDRLIVS